MIDRGVPGIAIALALLMIAACGKKKTGDPAAPPPATPITDAPAAPAPPIDGAPVAAWELRSKPVEVRQCAPATKAPPIDVAPDLPRRPSIRGCEDLPSIDAVCACLVKSFDTWSVDDGPKAPVSCAPTEFSSPLGRIVELRGAPVDPDAVAAGTIFVLVVARAKTWTAVHGVEAAPDVDLTETPNATHGATIVGVETRPLAGGTLFWIQGQNQASETDMGETEVSGAAHVTVCIAPASPKQGPFCFAPIQLGEWDYTFTIAKTSCEVRAMALAAASLTSASKLVADLDLHP